MRAANLVEWDGALCEYEEDEGQAILIDEEANTEIDCIRSQTSCRVACLA